MIRKLRAKLLWAAMLSQVLVLGVILGVILFNSYRGIVSDADRILDLLATNEGQFPDLPEDFDWEAQGPRRQSQELGYETRYFSVLLDSDIQVLETDTREIVTVDQDTAEAYAKGVLAQEGTRGFYQGYRYLVSQEEENTRVIFLDYSGNLFNFRSVFITSLWVSSVGLLAVLVILFLLSGRIIKPVIQSNEKQKRFITDAGHEIKTPVAIIQADTDVLALETGESNEWIQDIQQQIQRLAALTNDLIYLSRVEENQGRGQFVTLPLTVLVEKTAMAFQTLAKSQGKILTISLQPGLTIVGEERSLGQLVSILLDNALKYSPPGDEITLALVRQGKHHRLTVENTAPGIDKTLLENMFDRFYRGDASRNAGKGGYGIGLSIAKAVVQAHRGKLTAAARPGERLLITALLPAG